MADDVLGRLVCPEEVELLVHHFVAEYGAPLGSAEGSVQVDRAGLTPTIIVLG